MFRSLLVILSFSLVIMPWSGQALVTKDELSEVFQAFEKAYGPELASRNEYIEFNQPIGNFDWYELALVHASYVRFIEADKTRHIITIVGGMLRLDGFDQDAAALVLCHELGRGIGGPPYKAHQDVEEMASTEGQSDYFAARECLPRIWKHLKQKDTTVLPVALRLCDLEFQNQEERRSCYRSFSAMRGFMKLRDTESERTGLTASFEERDASIARELNLNERYYPSAQCRLDTLIAGTLRKARPLCWFPALDN